MPDVFSKVKRSQIMAAVSSSDTGPERMVAAILRSAGIKAVQHVATLPGRPDFVVEKACVAIFVNGCFWHGHTCPHGRKRPRSNQKYWEAKISKNMRRDSRVKRELRKLGFSVFTVWECRLRRGCKLTRVLKAIESCYRNSGRLQEGVVYHRS